MLFRLATSGGGVLVFVVCVLQRDAITQLLRYRFGNFVKRNKRKNIKKIDLIVCLGGKRLPNYSHVNIIVFPGDDNLSNTHN